MRRFTPLLFIIPFAVNLGLALAGGGTYKAPPPKFLGPNGVECPKCADPCPPAMVWPVCECNPAPSVIVPAPPQPLPPPPERPAAVAAPNWSVDVEAGYAGGPFALIGPRYERPSGWAFGLKLFGIWPHGGSDAVDVPGAHDAAPLHVPGCRAENSYGPAVLVSIPMKRRH